MNICIITSSFPSSPDDTAKAPFLLDFVNELRKREHRVSICTQACSGTKERIWDDVHVCWFPWYGSSRALVHLNPFNPVDFFRITSLLVNGKKTLASLVKENKIDLCFGLWVLPGGYFANQLFRRAGIPYSVWALGSDIYKYGKIPLLFPIMKRIILEARGVFADGFDMSKIIEVRFGRRCSFLATTRRLASPVHLTRHGDDNITRFLFVGRLERVKGIDVLLRAAALLAGEGNRDFHMTVVGSGSMENWARDFVRNEKIEHCVRMAGSIDDNALAALYCSCDCVIIPSRSESIPLVFSEALHFEKELIVTDVGDMGILGRDYGVASVISSENPSVLAGAMKKKIKKLDKANTTKRKELAELFDIKKSVDRFLSESI